MNNKKKSILYILGVFIIGFVIGFLINMAIVEKRIDNFRRMAKPRGMTSFIERTLDLSDDQKLKVENIFKEFEVKADSSRQLIKNKMKVDMAWLKSELKPILTENQFQKFEKRLFKGRPSFDGERNPFQREMGRREKSAKKQFEE
ncbi:MAG: hypothetical protein JEY94_02245 [Melioribacteraceae bacterium]|nr:hypothetical protein [Melioribacteraceae bacterium]